MRAARFVIAVACVLGPARLAAATVLQGGNVCHAALDSIEIVDRNQYGVANASSTNTAWVWCPLDRFSDVGDTLQVHVYDRHPSQNVDCYGLTLDADGDILDEVDNSSTGSSSAVQTISLLNFSRSGNMVVACSLPPLPSPGAHSYVTSFSWLIH
jgi:hypothetical protein